MRRLSGWVAAVCVLGAATLVAKELQKGAPVEGKKGEGVGKTASCPGCKGELSREGDIWECAKCEVSFDAALQKIECQGCLAAAAGEAPCEGCDDSDNGKCDGSSCARRDCKECKVRWGAGRAYKCNTCADAAEASKEGKPGICQGCKVTFQKGTPFKGGKSLQKAPDGIDR